jgi:hypothetical protein
MSQFGTVRKATLRPKNILLLRMWGAERSKIAKRKKGQTNTKEALTEWVKWMHCI